VAKNWWFPLDFRVWRTDSQLRRCSLETRALWLEVLCIMHETETATLTGTVAELSRLIGCESAELMRCATELKSTGAADVTLGNGFVTLVSRRRNRELSDREKTRLRVRKHRGNDDVTLHNKSKSNNNNKTSETDVESETFSEPRKEHFKRQPNLTPINPSLDLELNTWLGAVAVAVGAKDARSLSKFKKWEAVCMTAIQEQRDLGKFLKVIESEKERNRGKEQFFSPDTCLQTLQLNGSVKQSKWTHEV
jgi:hypothetical protein